MLKFETTNKFEKEYKKLPDQIKQIFKNQLKLFVDNPNHPSLHSKKIIPLLILSVKQSLKVELIKHIDFYGNGMGNP